MGKKIAIIGGGSSGLTSIKCCVDEGLEPVCLERTADFGGLWNYTEEVREGQACVMRSTIINTSKETLCYSDFPVPADFPNFMHNSKVMEYFRLYAEKFDLKKHIKLQTEVLKVKPAKDFDTSGQWIVDTKDTKSGDEKSEVYDGVMVCTGHHAEKKMPDYEGMDEFKGKIIHSHDYRPNQGLIGKRVVVVGFGSSGADALIDASQSSDVAYISSKRGAWVVKRLGPDGLPVDVNLFRRFPQYIIKLLPRGMKNTIIEGVVSKNFNHKLYGLKPKYRFDENFLTVCDELPIKIASGRVVVKPDVKRFTESGVEFTDGSVADDIDLVILATGYNIGFPFIDHPALEVKNNDVKFFKLVFPPDIVPSTLAVIGCVQPIGATIPMAEMQSRWAARIFSGCQALPSQEAIWEDVKRHTKAVSERYVDSRRQVSIQVEWLDYMDRIAEMMGCKPSFFSLLRSDSKLAFHYLFQTCTPVQYRLVGPGRWEGAREALLTTMDRVYKPYGTKPPGEDTKNSSGFFRKVLFWVIIAIVVKWLLF